MPAQRTNNNGLHRACDLCYKRKKKCDGALPCSTCSRLKHECTYTDRPVQNHNSELSASLLDRVARLEKQLALNNATASPSATPSSRMSLPNILSPTPVSTYSDYLSPVLRQQMEEKFFEVPNFIITREQFQNGHDAMRLIVFALVALHADFMSLTSHSELYATGREKLRALMDDEAKLYSNSTDIIRTWTLNGIYEFYTELYPRSWISIGIATRLVTCDSQNILDLPIEHRWRDRTAEQADLSRTLFWHVFLTDRLASWVTGFSPGLSVMGIRNFLCDERGISTGHRLQDDWRNKKLPVFAYLCIGASFFERTENLNRECFYADSGPLPRDVTLRKFEARSAEIHKFQAETSDNIDMTDAFNVGANLLLQLMIQAALLQLYSFGVDKDFPFHGRLKFAAFRSFLQLGSIDADFGIYNVILYHTLFKAGCALISLSGVDPDIDHDFTTVELSQGLVIILTMLNNLALQCPGAHSLIKQLESGMDGQSMQVSIPDLVKSRNESNASAALEGEEIDRLLEMFSQAAEHTKY